MVMTHPELASIHCLMNTGECEGQVPPITLSLNNCVGCSLNFAPSAGSAEASTETTSHPSFCPSTPYFSPFPSFSRCFSTLDWISVSCLPHPKPNQGQQTRVKRKEGGDRKWVVRGLDAKPGPLPPGNGAECACRGPQAQDTLSWLRSCPPCVVSTSNFPNFWAVSWLLASLKFSSDWLKLLSFSEKQKEGSSPGS